MGGTRLRQSLLAAGLLIALAAGAAAQPAAQAPIAEETNQVQGDVASLLRALYRGEVDVVLRYTHPEGIRAMGGPEAARSATEQAVRQMVSIGMRLESLSFPRAPDFIEGGGRRFVVVPTLSVLSANGQRVESLNFQLGALDPKTRAWTYVEGSRVNQENVRSLFPEFPSGYVFPEFYRKKL